MVLLILPLALASGQTTSGSLSLPDEGVLRLHLDSDVDQFLYEPASGPAQTQEITVTGCAATLSTSGSTLVTMSVLPTPKGSLGLFDDGLGVKTKGNGGNGQPCGRADGPDEALMVTLAGSLADKEIVFAELDIEGKFNVAVDATLYLDGTVVANAEPLLTGEASDSGPDSGDGDNYRWVIDEGVLFDAILLSVSPTTPDGAFSLEGGADGTAPGSLGITDSVFKLTDVDGFIPCGDSTISVGDGVVDPMASFVRGDDDAKNPDPCSILIGYNLDSTSSASDQTVSFEFETEEAPSWFGDFTWAPETAVVPVPATQVDGTDLEWCSGFSGVDGSTGDPLPIMPAGESWCLVTQNTILLVDGTMQVTQTIYGSTDPSFARPK